MKKVLFPTDFSEVSNNAFLYALKLADSSNAELIVLHVYNLPYIDMGGAPSNLLDVYDTIELQSFENLKDQIPVLRDIAEKNNLAHVKMSNILRHGEVVWTIQDIIKEEDIDFIVMGTKGASGLKETFLGSTTGSIIAETKVFVLGIPENCEYKTIKNIVFTTCFREKDIIALKKLLAIAERFHAKVHCLYVKTSKSDVKEITIQDWKMLFSNENIEFHIIESENVKDAVLNFTETQQIEMLAILKENRSFFEELFHRSLTQALSYHIKIPILALQEDKK